MGEIEPNEMKKQLLQHRGAWGKLRDWEKAYAA